MQCRKCKTELSEGETFCRKCATSIYVDDYNINNTNTEVNHNNTNIIKKISFNVKKESYIEPSSTQILSNKDLINNNQNNMEYARKSLIKSLVIIFSLLVLLIVTIIIISIIL